MKATDVLAKQAQLVHNRVLSFGNLSREEWMARLRPGDNPVGFLAWHIVATRDWTVRPMFQAKRPLGWDAPFEGTGIALCEIPFGMPAAEADEIAARTSPAEVVAYSEAVMQELTAWLGSIDDAALALPPPAAQDHLSLSPRYQERAYVHELEEDPDDMKQWPVWQLLTRPAITHCVGHLTEIGLARQALRT